MPVQVRVKDILSGLFAAEHLGQLKSEPSTSTMLAARPLLEDALPRDRQPTVADILDAAFVSLVREFPVEYVFKSCALERLLFGRHSPNTTAFYTEFPVGDSRADLLMVNGRAHVYEIKTRYDDLTRLSAQLNDYYRAFTHVTVFVDEAQATAVASCVPEYTGIAVLARNYSIRTIRPANEHSCDLEHAQVFKMLHQAEYMSILNRYDVDPRHIDPARRFSYCRDAFGELSMQDAHHEAVAALKRRQSTVKLAAISANLPRSLMLAPFAYRMTTSDWRSLSEQMRAQA